VEPDRGTLLTTGIAAAFAFAIGGAAGIVAAFTHRQFPPGGLLAGLAVVLALVAGFRLVFDSRAIAAAGAVGVLAATGLMMLPGAGGTVLVLDDPLGWIWALGPALLSAVVIAWPRSRTRRDAASGRSRMDA
jgi:N-acetyl-1-D-myo-inositol-2-amino-2-deoxy-alpha-D-glucopyranoside deacetylase